MVSGANFHRKLVDDSVCTRIDRWRSLRRQSEQGSLLRDATYSRRPSGLNTDVGDVPVDRHNSNRCSFGADDRDPAACGIADDPAMGHVDVVPVRTDNFSVAPFERKGVHRVGQRY